VHVQYKFGDGTSVTCRDNTYKYFLQYPVKVSQVFIKRPGFVSGWSLGNSK